MNGNGSAAATFDLDASRAARAEATHQRFTFTFQGKTYSLPAMDDFSLEAQGFLGQGDLMTALTMLLEGGEADYRALIAGGMSMGDVKAVFNALGKWAGVGDLGNFARPAIAGSTQT